MLSLVLSRSSRNLSYQSLILQRCYHSGKAGAVHTAIAKGLRKSRGHGFRGSPRAGLSADDSREKYLVEHGIPHYEERPKYDRERNFERKPNRGGPRESTNRWEGRGKATVRGKTEAHELRIRLGKSARDRIARHFRIEVIADRFLTIYRDIAGSPTA